MSFPDAKKIYFEKNTLNEVVCQLRFPPVLKIEAELPAEFQENIRDEFPNYIEESSVGISTPPAVQGAIPIEVRKQLDLIRLVAQQTADKSYRFFSEDEVWKLTLTRTFIALTTNKYERWEKYYEKLKKPLDALLRIYNPSYYTRIGLRYINVICRSDLALDKETDWVELLKPSLLGLLASDDVKDSVQDYQGLYEIGLDDGESTVRLLTKCVEKADQKEICFMIDSDFFLGRKIEISEAANKLKYFNVHASRLIQWCIQNKLYEALGPRLL